MSLPRTFARRHFDDGRLCLSSRNSPVLSRTNAFTVLPPLSPQIPGPPATPKPYRCSTPAKKEKSAFVILTELVPSRSPSPPGGRVSPFRGRGFKPNSSSRHSSPSADPPGTPRADRSRSKQTRIAKGVTGRSVPSSPSKKSSIPKPILRRSSLSPNRAKELLKTTAENGNNFLRVDTARGFPLQRKDTTSRKMPPISGKLRDDIDLKAPKVPTSILKSPKKFTEKDSNNNKMVKVDARMAKSKNEMNKKNLNVRVGKENTTTTLRKPTKDLNANIVKSPAKTLKNDTRKPAVTQKPPLPVEALARSKSSLSPNPRNRSPSMPPKNTTSSINNKNKQPTSRLSSRSISPTKLGGNLTSRSISPNKLTGNRSNRSVSPMKPTGKLGTVNSKLVTTADKKTADRASNNVSNGVSKNESKSSPKSEERNKINTTAPSSVQNESESLNSRNGQNGQNGKNSQNGQNGQNGLSGQNGQNKSPKKEAVRKMNGEPAKVETVNEKKVQNESKKLGSPSKSRPSSGKEESSVTLMKSATASGVVPAEPSVLPKVTSMVSPAESSKPMSKRISQVQGQAQSNSSSESVRSGSSRDTIRAVSRVKGTVHPSRSKVGSVSGRVKGGPDLEVLSANTLMRQGNNSNHAGSRMAWDEPPSRPTKDLTQTTTTSAKPTGCLGNICKILNCCKCCQSWQKAPKPIGVTKKASLLQRLNCFKWCPSMNRLCSMCGKLNCCRKLELSSCCQRMQCCKVPLSSCCRRPSTSDDMSDMSDESRIKCANMKSCWRFTFCLNRACCQSLRRMCRCKNLSCCKPGGCCGSMSPEEEAIRKKVNSRAAFKKSRTSSVFSDIPKLDQTFVEYNSIMRAAIPVLPVPVAWMCLILNLFLPGVGTFWSGVMCLCLGKPRFSVNDTPLARIGSFCVNLMVALAQMFTVLFCLVGWGWGIWWGTIMLRLARKHRRIKMAEAGAPENRPAPVVLNQNHTDPERGQHSIRA